MGKTTATVYEAVALHDDLKGTGGPESSSSSKEPAKIVSQRYGSNILGRPWFWIHLSTALIVGGVIYLNIVPTYGWEIGNALNGHVTDTTMNNALLFAAHAVSGLMNASISMIMLQKLLSRLLSRKGLELGLAAAGYQTGVINCFLNKSFWASFRGQDFFVGLSIALVIVFEVTLTPLCGTLLQARTQWWDSSSAGLYDNDKVPTVYLNTSYDEFYPRKLSLEDMSVAIPWHCMEPNYNSRCPGAAYSQLKEWTLTVQMSDTLPMFEIVEEISQASTQMIFDSRPDISNNPDALIAISAVAPSPFIETVALFEDYCYNHPLGHINNITSLQLVIKSPDEQDIVGIPMVSAQCTRNSYTAARSQTSVISPAPDVVFPTGLVSNSFIPANESALPFKVPPQFWDFDHDLDATNFTWIDVSDSINGPNDSGISIGALFTYPTWHVDSSATIRQDSVLDACLVSASWAEAQFSVDPSQHLGMVSRLMSKNYADYVSTGRNDTSFRAISIDSEWANFLDVANVTDQSTGNQTTMMRDLLQSFIVQTTYLDPTNAHHLETFSNVSDEGHDGLVWTLSAVVTEGLSRQAYHKALPFIVFGEDSIGIEPTWVNLTGDQYPYPLNTLTKAAGAMKVNLVIEHQVYGWGEFHDEWTSKWGFASLFLYLVILIIYVTCLVCANGFVIRPHRQQWCDTLGTMDEMLALALVSPSARDELHGVGGGVKKSSTWCQRLRLRDDGNGSLGLFVGNDDMEAGIPKTGKMYY